MEKRIPQEYQRLWSPYETDKVLYHLTTKEGLTGIMILGHIEPRDPTPRNWAGMKTIFMADPDDPIYLDSLPNVMAHAKKKGEHLIRLHIKTTNTLYRSTDPERTFQVMSLDPIPVAAIVDQEDLSK